MCSPSSLCPAYLPSPRIDNFTVSSALTSLLPPYFLDNYILATSLWNFACNARLSLIFLFSFLFALILPLSNLQREQSILVMKLPIYFHHSISFLVFHWSIRLCFDFFCHFMVFCSICLHYS